VNLNNLILTIFTIALFSGCTQRVWISEEFNTIKSDIDTLSIIFPHVKYSEKIGETEIVKLGHCIFVSNNVANILMEIINEGKFIPKTLAVRNDSILLQKWIPNYFLNSIAKYENLNKSNHLFNNGESTFPVITELQILIDKVSTKYFLFVLGKAFGTSSETKDFDILQAQTHAILWDQAFSYDYQWIGLQLQLYIIDKNSDKILWYNANSRSDNKYNSLRNEEIKALCEKLLKQR
jgi:hypothetical protein